ncbi:hypothetical protein AN403_4937 [Pseudomonas fluorescens]|uniref:Uncharacterized protein n=1 Tax=Pseudomonas fluorescens TaxID=294 RepID=A0A0P9BC86_PSEFL|nr:hypothetical protein AN403_4937 [Pseudomonas fluorescens]
MRLAAQGVRILDLFAVLVGVGDFAALAQQIAVSGGGVDLALLATGGVDARVERRTRTQHRFNGQAAQGQGTGEQVFTFEQAAQGERGGHLGAVEQGQAFFRGQGQRGQTGDFQRFGGFHPLALVTGLTFAQQHQRHVGQRRQVTGRTDRAFQRNVRVHLGIDQGDQRVDHHAADAGETTAQAVDLEHHDQAHQLVADRLADAGGVGQHQRALQVFQVFAGDAGRGQQAETGVDAVGGAVLGEDLLHAGHAGFDPGRGAVVEGDFDRLLIDITQLGEAQLAGDQV